MRDFSPEPPLESQAPGHEAVPTSATGLPAVWSSTKISLREMGLSRTEKVWREVNQVDGFDCPSCAWADPVREERSALEFCENGAKAFSDDATRKVIDADELARVSVAELAQHSDLDLNAMGRLGQPLYLAPGSGHYAAIEWDHAFSLIATELKACETPHQAAFYTSGKAINESAFLFQLLARRFGTNNLPDCSNMCHESSGVALKEALGAGKATVTLEDLEQASVIIVIGQNPGTNHPRMLTALAKAKHRGAKIIAINPLREVGLERFVHPQEPFEIFKGGTAIADLYLQVRINGDVALLAGIAKLLVERHALDTAFLTQYTTGFDAYREHLATLTWPELEATSGLTRPQFEEATALLANSKGTVACWAMGLTQHENAVDNIRELTNLLLLGGHVGRPGAGMFCVRGHSNVQGDRTMGIAEKMPEAFYAALEREFQFTCPREPGLNTVEAIEAMERGEIRVFIALGGNFLSATPDTLRVAAGLRRTRLTVSIATKLNRSHLVCGDASLILPCRSRTELDQVGSVENTISWVSPTRGLFPPITPHVRSEAAIVAGIADALFGTTWQQDFAADYAALRERIENVVPGFADFNRRLGEGGFYAPVPPKQREFPTLSGKAEFAVNALPDLKLPPGTLRMMTIRTHDQFNTVVYGNDDRYRGIRDGRRVIFLNPADMASLGLKEMQLVDLSSDYAGHTRHARQFRVIPYNIPQGDCATYFPESNPLVPLEQRARKSHTPASKSVVIRISPHS